MKRAFSFLFVFLSLSVQAQLKNKLKGKELFYFYGKDSLVGVKDGNEKIVIPAAYRNYFIEDIKQPIADEAILLYAAERKEEPLGYSTSMFYFNREGKFLIHPFWYDNGPDHLEEGLMRFVERNRMGFADRYGNIKLPAIYNYVSYFNHGVSFVCNGCSFYKDSTEDPEHNIFLTKGNWLMIDKEGNVLKELTEQESENYPKRDSLLSQLAKFSYTSYEQTILKKLEAVPNLKKYLAQGYSTPPPDHTKIRFHIVEKPSYMFPYYMVKSFGYWNGQVFNLDTDFLVTKDGKKVYRYWGIFEPDPIHVWLTEMKARERKK